MTRKQKDENTEDSIPTISEESSELGSIRINHSVVAGIVRLATQSVTGVVNVGGAGVVEGLDNVGGTATADNTGYELNFGFAF